MDKTDIDAFGMCSLKYYKEIKKRYMKTELKVENVAL